VLYDLGMLALLLLLLPWTASAAELRGQVVDPAQGEYAAFVPLALYRVVGDSRRSYPEPWVREDGGDSDRVVGRMESDAEGRFQFTDLAPGRYRLRAGPRTLELPLIEVAVQEGPPKPLRVEVPLGGRVSGVLVSPDGEPVVPGFVWLAGIETEDGRNRLAGDSGVNGVGVDEQGRFWLHWLPAGRLHVQGGRRDFGLSVPVAVDVDQGSRESDLRLVVPDQRAELSSVIGNAGGVGVRLNFTPDGPTVRTLVDGMPAQAAGLRESDLLASVDGRPTRFMTAREFVLRLRGPIDSPVVVTVHRGEERFEATIVRAELPRRSK